MAETLGFGSLNVDANTLYETGFYSVIDTSGQYNLPIIYGTLICLKTNGSYPVIQVCFNRSVNGDRIYYRTSNGSKEWGDWSSLS